VGFLGTGLGGPPGSLGSLEASRDRRGRGGGRWGGGATGALGGNGVVWEHEAAAAERCGRRRRFETRNSKRINLAYMCCLYLSSHTRQPGPPYVRRWGHLTDGSRPRIFIDDVASPTNIWDRLKSNRSPYIHRCPTQTDKFSLYSSV
jgi:hypothetical protein